jgi:S-DNA-T family DNA segregation ATPase FtsK/SpoIIIE
VDNFLRSSVRLPTVTDMEMTLTVHVPRRRPHPVDVLVEWAGHTTAAELCDALAAHLGEPVPSLTAGGTAVPPSAEVGMPPLLHGASVTVAPDPGQQGAAPRPSATGVLELVVVGGPDAGRSHPLLPPGIAVGRAPAAGLHVHDEALSRRHVTVEVGPHGVTVDDCGSTNGVVVDGRRVDRPTAIDVRSTVEVGSTTLRLRRACGAGPPVRCPGDGTALITLSQSPPVVGDDLEIGCPAAPPDRHRARVPWIAALAPVPVAIALAVFLGPQLLLFAALGPVSLLAGALGERLGTRRRHRRAVAAHALEVATARARLADALRGEVERLDLAHPDPARVLSTAEQRRAGLWGGSSACVRLGRGELATRVVWVDGASRSRPVVGGAPLVVDLDEVGCLGVVGPPEAVAGLLSGLVGQLCVAHPPHQLTVSVTARDPSWSWVARLPHAVDGTDAAAVGSVRRRLLVVPRAGPETSSTVSAARAEEVLVVVGASARTELPGGCRAVAERVRGAWVFDGPGGPAEFVPDRVREWWTDRLSRALAPVRCSNAVATGGIPPRVTLADLLAPAEVTDGWVADRWRRHRGGDGSDPGTTPSAVVGTGPSGPHVIDLCRDGPHVLVGGTTGSGKSEFLRTLVTSLAISTPPEELTFVLVDFKGGAAFGACAGLPHVVGLVTDLDDHLVTRALSSLRAELRRRERLFAAVGASDLQAYQRLRGADDEPVPRLVVVVDELRALVDELPEFVTGLVRLAALGRSLGVHLVLATQRPSGAVSAEIQANVSLRIAFRVRDRADSLDILDDGSAAAISPGTPGRALSRGADGTLVPFQAATVASRRSRTATGLRVGTPAGAGLATTSAGTAVGDADAQAASVLVAAVQGAHRRLGGGLPRSPWLAPLPALVRPALRADRAEAGPVVVGLVDEPDLQRISPLTWSESDGSWLVVGGSGTGRTTALRALGLAAATSRAPTTLHLHAIDTHGSLADLDALPHVGTRVGSDHPRACAALVRHLGDEVDRRLGAAAPGRSTGGDAARPTMLLLVDGWEQLVEAQTTSAADDLSGQLVRLLRDGRSVGLVGAVAGGRALLHPRWGGVAAATFLLGTIDPLDSALAGLRASDAPREPPLGRAVRVHDRREVQLGSVNPADCAAVSAAAGRRPVRGAAWRWFALPSVVRRPELVADHPTSAGEPARGPVPMGLGAQGVPWCWRPADDGRRLLVAGPPRSGRTNTLCVVAESLCATGRPVAVVTARPDRSGRMAWPPDTVLVGSHQADLLVRLRLAHHDLAVLVDDANLLDDSPVLPALRELAGLVERDDGLVVVSTTAAALTDRFRGLDIEVGRHGCRLLLDPAGQPREVLGGHQAQGIPRLPGRGLFVAHGEGAEVQVLLADGSGHAVGGVATWQHLGVRVSGDPGGDDRHDRHHDDDPPGHRTIALDQAQADRQQEDVPHQGRGPRPLRRSEPATGQQPEPDTAEQDQQGRHEHPRGVTALPQHELHDVVDGEAGEGHRLEPGEQCGEAAGAA